MLPTMMSLLTRFAALAVSAACLPSASFADLRNNQQIEDACYPMAAANEALARMPAFQATWDLVIKRPHQRSVIHSESVYDNGVIYQRRAPYQPWRSKPYSIVDNARRSDCHQLREEVLDDVNTVVIFYRKHHLNDPRFYRCTVWIEIPEYRNRKSDCVSVDSAEVVEVKIRWFYRTDIKPPVIAPG
ncbi:hypothetical protein [Mesorhizobium sp.]|uniref:hypothetical protein n=1 Tax=Mesorhizobium sp. TaxID=1871066 RepID=UPI000FE6633E|nr:hypothetical protein [Mesorhizobium sp.]RWC38337.1 MAG: hypothetical protein EOS28_30305 [Mesorhizobium sp.]RWE90290.1 MAG: hypothetical protein EOS68_31030 [Mesorhizobium sp.]